MSQLTVNDEPVRAYEGKIDVSPAYPTTFVTGLANGLIYFGKAVSRAVADVDPGASAATGGQTVNLFALGEKYMGVAVADASVETPQGQGFGAYPDLNDLPVLRKGRVWVVSADAVDDLSKSVWVRDALPGGSPPADSLGSFRATTAADHTDIGALGTEWVAGITIGGVNFGLLELNLP